MSTRCLIFTEADIDEAWKKAIEKADACGWDRTVALSGLAELGIVACKCSWTRPAMFVPNDLADAGDCPACNGHGWVRKEVSDE